MMLSKSVMASSVQVPCQMKAKHNFVSCRGIIALPAIPRLSVSKVQAVRPRRVRVQAVAEPSTLERESQGQAIALGPEVAELPQGAQDAILAAATVASTETPAERQLRKRRAEDKGYRTIGLELPDTIKLSNVVQSIPKEAFKINPVRAWGAVLTTICSVSLSVYLISISPWYMLPLAWAFAGTAWTGMFVVGHDCGHRSFSENKLVEDIVGTLMFMPLIYPFEPWRIKHNQHHAFTNQLTNDTAWHPVPESDADSWGPVQGAIYKGFLGSPLKLWASVGHWLLWHFDLKKYEPEQQTRVKISLAAVALFMGVAFPLITYYTGFAGLAKYWLMPWLGYHFWMSTFTVVHHTAAHIPFKASDEWNPAKAQLSGTVHCDYPALVEFLCHDINVHVPHHVNSKIPWYNLRMATDALRKYYGEFMTEGEWNPRMMKSIFTELHMFDEKNNYKPFDWKKEQPFWWFQRKFLPDSMKPVQRTV